MSTAIQQNPHALAILETLANAGLTVGDHHGPKDTSPPYTVLYMLPGGFLDGPMCDPEADGDLQFQLTSVGRLASEARWEADQAATAITTTPITVAGRSIQRARASEASNGVRRDDDVSPPLYFVAARFALISRPS